MTDPPPDEVQPVLVDQRAEGERRQAQERIIRERRVKLRRLDDWLNEAEEK